MSNIDIDELTKWLYVAGRKTTTDIAAAFKLDEPDAWAQLSVLAHEESARIARGADSFGEDTWVCSRDEIVARYWEQIDAVQAKPKGKRRQRVVEILRKWSPGEKWYDWRFDYAANQWTKKDGTKVKSVSRVTIGVNGGETYRSEWWIEIDGKWEPAPRDLLKLLPVSKSWTE